MKLKQQFAVLIGVMAVLMAVVCGVGYYMAQSMLSDNINKQLKSVVEVEGGNMEQWLTNRASMLDSVGSALSHQPVEVSTSAASIPYLGGIANEKTIVDLTNGTESGMAFSWVDGDISGPDYDPRTRDWYKEVKSTGKPVYTEAYTASGGSMDGKLVISYAVPLTDPNGTFQGAICEDIGLDILKEVVGRINYDGQGEGIIIDKKGQILASAGEEEPMSLVTDDETLAPFYKDMVSSREGFLDTTHDGQDSFFAYTTLEGSDWIVGVFIPSEVVFAPLASLKLAFAVIIVISLILMGIGGTMFANRIASTAMTLRDNTMELATGNLTMPDLPVEGDNEFGQMTEAFNAMKDHLHNLIKDMNNVSQQVAASSQELTAGAHQSAEAATNVAETITQVAEGMHKQNQNIDTAKQEVDALFLEIHNMSYSTKEIASASNDTADAAKLGERLMQDAMQKMGNIESSVMSSANTVRVLGDNSNEISIIVDTIVSIADQTNLLALNAAIEAARAGEAGKGFAVVAEEVRKLAAESQSAAEQIQSKIASIQSDTEHAVAAMKNGTADVQQGTTAINEVGTQFADIMKQVANIKEKIDTFQEASQRIADGANKIVVAVDSIDEVSRETAAHTETISAAAEEQSASSEEIASSSNALAQMAVELQESINKFKV